MSKLMDFENLETEIRKIDRLIKKKQVYKNMLKTVEDFDIIEYVDDEIKCLEQLKTLTQNRIRYIKNTTKI